MDRRVSTVMDMIRDAAQEGRHLSQADLARAINLSPSRLRHLFKAETGWSPAHYLRMLRLERAKTLLETTFLTVKQVMNGVGLNDESHFVRDFKQTFGSSPKRHRVRVWDQIESPRSVSATDSDGPRATRVRNISRRAGTPPQEVV